MIARRALEAAGRRASQAQRTSTHDHLVAALRNALLLAGAACVRVNQRTVQKRDGSWSSPGADVGAPDLSAVLPPHGHALWIEAKGGAGGLTAAQHVKRRACERAGGTYLVARSVDDLRPILEALRSVERASRG